MTQNWKKIENWNKIENCIKIENSEIEMKIENINEDWESKKKYLNIVEKLEIEEKLHWTKIELKMNIFYKKNKN